MALGLSKGDDFLGLSKGGGFLGLGKGGGFLLLLLVVVVVALAFLAAHAAAKKQQPAAAPDDIVRGGGKKRRSRPMTLRVREPGYTAMLKRKKPSVVGRLRTGAFAPDKLKLKSGDPVVIARSRAADGTVNNDPPRRYRSKVIRVQPYKSLDALLKEEKAHGATKEEFAPFYTPEQMAKEAAVAIEVEPPAAPAP